MITEVRRRLPAGRRGRLVSVLLVAVLAGVLVAAGLLLTGGRGDSSGRAVAATATTTATTTSTPSTTPSTTPGTSTTPSPGADGSPPPVSPAPSGPTSDATALPAAQEPVALEETARVGDVEVSLADIAEIEGEATGPGEVAGPAVQVTVRLQNGTAEPLDLLGVEVSMTYGADLRPASPLGDPAAAMFSGVLEPGASAEGVYVFRIPPDARDEVSVSVGYQPGSPRAVFTGAV